MLFTSGKVPFEKTLPKRKRSAVGAGGKTGLLREQSIKVLGGTG